MTYFSSPKVHWQQSQVIMGTILGGSTIVKPPRGVNCYLFMRSNNLNWINYKSAELIDFSSQQPITKDSNTFRWHSNCYPMFNEYRDMFYKGQDKIISMDTLNKLGNTALAIWYGDCGHMRKGCTVINTCKFKEDGTKTIVQYFNEVGIEASLFKERNNCRVLLSKDGTEKFFMITGHLLPEFMYYKLED